MDKNNPVVQIFLFSLFLGIILLIGWQLLPTNSANQESVTVTGTAQGQQKNEVASFSAGVYAINDSKEIATNEVNQKIDKLIEAVKAFGIATEDIKTQNLSISQQEDISYEGGTRKSKLGQWRANNTIEITLRDVGRASELAQLLTKSGANNVYGPNFTTEDTTATESVLIEEAINNARTKAEAIAKASKRRLGKVIMVTEGSVQSPIYYGMKTDVSYERTVPVEPGSQDVYKTMTVTFELR